MQERELFTIIGLLSRNRAAFEVFIILNRNSQQLHVFKMVFKLKALFLSVLWIIFRLFWSADIFLPFLFTRLSPTLRSARTAWWLSRRSFTQQRHNYISWHEFPLRFPQGNVEMCLPMKEGGTVLRVLKRRSLADRLEMLSDCRISGAVFKKEYVLS